MEPKHKIRQNKVAIVDILSTDYIRILNKVHEQELITQRDYNNLKDIKGLNDEEHVVKLVDKIIDRGEDTCQEFLNLLQTDEDIKGTYPELKKIQWTKTSLLPKPVQASSAEHSDGPSQEGRRKEDEQYQLNSQPTGLCVIINNENFMSGDPRRGTNEDAESLGKVFSWLGFRVLMCKDQTMDQMDRALKCFASLSDLSQLQEFRVQEWSSNGFTDLQEAPKHGDAFICCILSHGASGVVSGIDRKHLSIKQIIGTFKATDQSPLTDKPKVFLIQACQGNQDHKGVLLKDLEADGSHSGSIPEGTDILVARATVDECFSYRHPISGSWFIQSVCQQLKEGCQRGDDIKDILQRVNNDVSQKEAAEQPGTAKQMSEVTYTLRKTLVLTPR